MNNNTGKTIYAITASEVEKYIKDKGIGDCPFCKTKNSIKCLSDEFNKVLFKSVQLGKYNEFTELLEVAIDGCFVVAACTHCGITTSISPVNIASNLGITL